MNKNKNKATELTITNYCHPDCEPLKNIMLLPEEEAFALAGKLALAHPETTAFYRFGDFDNYYRLRKESDESLYRAFISLGGLPDLMHPYSFVLEGSDWLDRWFGYGKATRIPLSSIPGHILSASPTGTAFRPMGGPAATGSSQKRCCIGNWTGLIIMWGRSWST